MPYSAQTEITCPVAVSYSGHSDTGDSRPCNQDSVFCRADEQQGRACGLFIVADGMGGLSAGEIISGMIVNRFARWWEEELPRLSARRPEDLEELLEQEIWDANSAALAYSREKQQTSGSTLSLLCIADERYYVKNLGDSRVYLLRAGVFRQLTVDQTLTAQLVRENRLTPEEALRHKQRSTLTMCIGAMPEPKPFTAKGTLQPGDVFLLCSDGLYNCLSDKEMAAALENDLSPRPDKAKELRALIAPGLARDNVSAIVVYCD